jgi:NAD/NADP transhydrogenase beta subunit
MFTSELATVSYIGATILFILSLGGLSNQETAHCVATSTAWSA